MNMKLVVTPERMEKTRRIMEALAGSFPRSEMVLGAPEDQTVPFTVWGQLWVGAKIVPQAMRSGVPFYYIDNGFIDPAKGEAEGYYSVTFRGLKPMSLREPDLSRLPVRMGKWRNPQDNPNGQVLIAVPGPGYGEMFGWDMGTWLKLIIKRVREIAPHRTILLREKSSRVPLKEHMERASVMITHSSKAAVEAVVSGLPVICEPHCAAAPVAGTDLRLLDRPPMPERGRWWASLMCQNFTLEEMRSGFAKFWLETMFVQGTEEIESGIPPQSELVAMR